MQFSNEMVPTEHIPSALEVQFSDLSPRYRPSHMLTTGGIFTVILLILSGIRFQPFIPLPEELESLYPVVAAAILAVMFLSLLYIYFADPLKQYALREQDLNYRHGLFFKHLVTQPILRIQHVEIKRGPVERIMGLASIQVFSAGGAMHTFEIPGLTDETAQQLRAFILSHGDLNTHG